MKTIELNNELVLAYTDDFELMSKEEIAAQNTPFGTPEWALKSVEKHIVMTGGFKEINGFSAMMLNAKDVVKKQEPQIEKVMKPYGYKLDGFITENIGGREAEGFRYTYTVQDTGMSGEMLVCKAGKELFYLHVYYRTALKEESLAALNEMLAASSWK